MTVSFETTRADFVPNVEDLKIQQLVLYFSRADCETEEITVDNLLFTEEGSDTGVGGAALSIDGIVSTRSNDSKWQPMLDKTPFGKWVLALPNTEEMKQRFKDEEIENILFVITYQGETAAWPV